MRILPVLILLLAGCGSTACPECSTTPTTAGAEEGLAAGTCEASQLNPAPWASYTDSTLHVFEVRCAERRTLTFEYIEPRAGIDQTEEHVLEPGQAAQFHVATSEVPSCPEGMSHARYSEADATVTHCIRVVVGLSSTAGSGGSGDWYIDRTRLPSAEYDTWHLETRSALERVHDDPRRLAVASFEAPARVALWQEMLSGERSGESHDTAVADDVETLSIVRDGETVAAADWPNDAWMVRLTIAE